MLDSDGFDDPRTLLPHRPVEVGVREAEDGLRHVELHEECVHPDRVGLLEEPREQWIQRVVQLVVPLAEEQVAVDPGNDVRRDGN